MKKYLISFVLLSFFCLKAEIPEPYRSIQVLPYDPHGWFVNAQQLDMFLKTRNIKTIIEVGSWLGCSTRYLASSIDGVVYTIDTWLGSPDEVELMNDPRLSYLYQQFLSNVIHANLTDKIIPVRMKSIEASNALNVKADLIYLDGAHDLNSVFADIFHWMPHLAEDGVMCGDDWLKAPVRQAVVHYANLHGKKVNAVGNFWWYE